MLVASGLFASSRSACHDTSCVETDRIVGDGVQLALSQLSQSSDPEEVAFQEQPVEHVGVWRTRLIV